MKEYIIHLIVEIAGIHPMVQFITYESLAASGNYVYAAVPSGAGVYRSVDNGVNWTVSLQSTVDYVEVAAKDNYAYAGSFFGGARYSSNYGSGWSVCNGFPSDASIFAIGAVGDGMVLFGQIYLQIGFMFHMIMEVISLLIVKDCLKMHLLKHLLLMKLTCLPVQIIMVCGDDIYPEFRLNSLLLLQQLIKTM